MEWVIPDDLVPRYATNVVVQHDENEFVISFFELQKPIVIGTPEQRKKAVDSIHNIRARCVSQIILSPRKMKDFIGAMETNLKRYEERSEDKEKRKNGSS
ncbi:MAG: DUF3467 domain-containing protein [Candidatus Binatia bacterium]